MFSNDPLTFAEYIHHSADWHKAYSEAWNKADGPDWKAISRLDYKVTG